MSLKQRIDGEIKKAMLAKENDRLRALRGIKSLILLAESEKGNKDGLTEEQEFQILTRAAKQRKDSADIYKEQSRDDLAEKELLEVNVIQEFLPEQMSESDIEQEVAKIIKETGATGMKDMGKVMGMATKAMAGRAEGRLISEIVKKNLS